MTQIEAEVDGIQTEYDANQHLEVFTQDSCPLIVETPVDKNNDMKQANLPHTEISTEVWTCPNSRSALQWVFQQPMMIAPWFIFSPIHCLGLRNLSVASDYTYTEKNLFCKF